MPWFIKTIKKKSNNQVNEQTTDTTDVKNNNQFQIELIQLIYSLFCYTFLYIKATFSKLFIQLSTTLSLQFISDSKSTKATKTLHTCLKSTHSAITLAKVSPNKLCHS